MLTFDHPQAVSFNVSSVGLFFMSVRIASLSFIFSIPDPSPVIPWVVNTQKQGDQDRTHSPPPQGAHREYLVNSLIGQ